jgi:hypothetical protein
MMAPPETTEPPVQEPEPERVYEDPTPTPAQIESAELQSEEAETPTDKSDVSPEEDLGI